MKRIPFFLLLSKNIIMTGSNRKKQNQEEKNRRISGEVKGEIMKTIRNLISIVVAVVLVISFASVVSAQDAVEPKVVKVGTEGAYPPHNYVREDGVVDGFDIAVLRAVDELIPELEFEYVPTAWDGIFVALEVGEFEIIGSSLGKNAEREERYLFTEIPYRYGAESIIFKSGRTDINTLEDLFGKVVATSIGTQRTSKVEEYNEKNGNQIELIYTDGNINNALLEVDSGRVDATINNIIPASIGAEELGIEIDSRVIEEFGFTPIHFLFVKTDEGERYRDLVDKALEQLIADGTLAEISIEYLGADYSTEEAARRN